MKSLVILPSYNEAENIADLIRAILNQGEQFHVLVVDDNSPDGTAEKVRALVEDSKGRLHLIVRQKKDGRGGAVRHGLEWGLKNGDYAHLIEMDCDFSHPPTDLVKGVALLQDHDVVLGCRYPDGKIVGWPLKRKILSFSANLLARILISRKIADYTNGYRFYSRKAARFLCEFKQQHKGYIYLSETLGHFLKADYKVGKFPILFVNRERGVSNTSLNEVVQAFRAIFEISWDYHFGKKV